MINRKTLDVIKAKGFVHLWEAVDYMINGGLTDIQALMIGCLLFEGKLWENVIDTSGEITESGDLLVEIHIMTSDANPFYKEIYKAHIQTYKYSEVPELEGYVKSFKIKLTSELAIQLFKNGSKNINY